MTKNRFIRLSALTILLSSLTILLCGCQGKRYFKFEGKIYDDSYNYKNDYGYKYLEKTNEKVAKFYEEIYLKMVEFDYKKQNVKENMCHTLFYEGNFLEGPFSYDDLYKGYMYLTAYNPQFYWMSYILDEDSGSYSLGIARAYAKASERKRYEKEINDGIKKVDKLLEGVEDEFDKIKIISDHIMDNMTYAFDHGIVPSQEQWAHSITGFFDRKEGVCESYAKVFKLLCDRYDIGNIPVTSEDHIWNLVEYDNEWYVFDLTYDDDARNSYVGKTEEVYEDDAHIYHIDLYPLPENKAITPLSLGLIELKENGNTICSSHSITKIFNSFKGGDYEIIMNTTTDISTDFYLSDINSNYNSLTIKTTQNSKLYLGKDITLTKDLTLSNLTLRAKESRTLTLDEVTIYLDNASIFSIITVEGGSVINIDE